MRRLLPLLWLVSLDAPAAEPSGAPLPSVDDPPDFAMGQTLDSAVVIAIPSYPGISRSRAWAEEDARAMARFLVESRGVPSDRVSLVLGADATRAGIERALALAGLATVRDGVVWVYFAGLGTRHPDTHELTLLPVDATESADGVRTSGLIWDDLETLANCRSTQLVVIADALQGPVEAGGASPTESAAEKLPTSTAEVGTAVGLARHGAFTYALLGALRGWADGVGGPRDGNVTVPEAMAYLAAMDVAMFPAGSPYLAATHGGYDPLVMVKAGSVSFEAAPELSGWTEMLPLGARASSVKPQPAPPSWVGASGYKMVWVPAGSFDMGSPASEVGRESVEQQHRVTLTKGYWVGVTEVTQALWSSITGSNPAHFQACGPECPVETVSWCDSLSFANALSRKDGLMPVYGAVDGCSSSQGSVTWDRSADGYRLATEAEWERAARGGQTGLYAGGVLNAVAWYNFNSGNKTHEVCTKQPNAMGLCDASGNVAEWTWDVFNDTYPSGADPVGGGSSPIRVFRGGSWQAGTPDLRVASRGGLAAGDGVTSLGLRLVRSSVAP